MPGKIAVLVFSFIILVLSCDITEPPPPEKTITLTLEDVSCIEGWIKLTTTNLQLPTTITLKQTATGGDQTLETINLEKADTLLQIDSLLPNNNYQYQASSIQHQLSSNELSVTTLDTTSHDFTWQTWTFGEHSSGVLYDVAIIDENNIWAVGEIYMNDSLGQPDPKAYNAVHWDGTEWSLKRIRYYGACSAVEFPPLKAIWAFSENNIIITNGGSIGWFDGNIVNLDCGINLLLTGSIKKIWGSSSNDLYIVGYNGNIAHYQNEQWSKIENGFDVDLQDIAGTPNNEEIWTCGWNYQTGQSVILKIKDLNTETIWDSEIAFPYNEYDGFLSSIYANGNSEFVLVGGQVFRHSLIDKRIVRREWVPYLNGWIVLDLGNFAYRIKGSNKNNIIAAGDAGMIWHYNGKSWHKFEEIYNLDDRLYGLAVTDNLIAATGKRYGSGLGDALLIIGRR